MVLETKWIWESSSSVYHNLIVSVEKNLQHIITMEYLAPKVKEIVKI